VAVTLQLFVRRDADNKIPMFVRSALKVVGWPCFNICDCSDKEHCRARN